MLAVFEIDSFDKKEQVVRLLILYRNIKSIMYQYYNPSISLMKSF
jgi:hypothetical protein